MLVLYTKPYGAGSRQASTGWGWGARLIVVVHLIPFVQPLLPRLELGKKEESPGKGAGGQAQGVWATSSVRPGWGGSSPPGNSNSSAQYLTANQHTANGVAKPPEGPGQAAWPIFQANQPRGERWVGAWCRWDRGWWDASSVRRCRFLPPLKAPLLDE